MRSNKPWKVLFVSLAAALSLSMLSACSSGKKTAEDNSTVLATYKGGEITQKEFDTDVKVMKLLSPEQAQYLDLDAFKETILKQEVAFEYLAAQANDKAKQEGEKQADSQIASYKQGLGETYESSLKEQGVTEDEIKNYMVRVLTVYQDMIQKVTDDEVKKEFEATKGDFTVASVRHILVGFTDSNNKERSKEDALKRAQEVKAKLDGGADFAATAKEYSDDTGSKDNGGLYENKELGTYVEEFKKAAQTLPLNTISDPVETTYGYHIMKVESRTEKTFDQLTDQQKETIKSTVASNKLQEFMEKNLDSIIEKINLPKSSAAPAASAAPAGSPAASAAPAASPSASAGAK
ncbi:peptidylprolyl isomerase [Paenibacillus sp. HN-1]|uniref:peptidylprolyl isomerase n=1 Tax=Paenibacillus TaxID=44249 RepID=UPI001CA81286|nr:MULTISPECIES: peptidylprolyl isomerase [Paenibacillus]MBY9082566.1 peptidylprolyl isomerase [Paenibacillus sp. CGMCC 1.18879]MBY9086645.1 peptidylprolyl isomerase [Paenibacillus sinensis]